jgi:hypothetical protein
MIFRLMPINDDRRTQSRTGKPFEIPSRKINQFRDDLKPLGTGRNWRE